MNCRCCNHELDTQEQPALVPGRAPSTLITCWNSFCPLHGYTFTAEGYAYVDLTAYCPDAPIDEATQQMQARVALITERMALFGESGADAPCGDGGTDVGAAMWTTSDGTQIPVAEMSDKHLTRAIERVMLFRFERLTLEEHESALKSLLPLRDELRRRGLEVPPSYYAELSRLRERIAVEEGR